MAPNLEEKSFNYVYFSGRGRDALTETFGNHDPFKMSAREIVERVLASGNTPDLQNPRRQIFPTGGSTAMVVREDQAFVVMRDEAAQTVEVFERREDAYERE